MTGSQAGKIAKVGGQINLVALPPILNLIVQAIQLMNVGMLWNKARADLKKGDFWKSIIVFLIATYVIVIPSYVFAAIMKSLGVDLGQSMGLIERFKDNTLESAIVMVLYASVAIPAIETVIFQTIPIQLMVKQNRLKKHPGVIIAISAALFSSCHFFDVAYVLNTFFIGLVFAYMYLFYQEKYEEDFKMTPFLPVFFVHSLRNLIATMLWIGAKFF